MGRLTQLFLTRPFPSLAVLGLASLVLAAGLPQLTTDVGYRAFLGDEHPAVRRFDAFLEDFGGGLGMAAVWSCDESAACRGALDPEALAMAARVETALAGHPALGAVRSAASARLLVPTPFGPVPRRLLEEDGRVAPDLARLAERARLDPGWRGQLVSADGRVGAVVVELVSSGSDEAREAYAALDEALAPEEARGFVFHRVGGPVEFVVAGGELEAATARMIPVMVLLVAAVLGVLFRSLWPALASLASVGLAVVWTMGLLGWLSRLGFAQNSLTQTLPPLVLVIGVCDAIHLVARAASPEPIPDVEERRRRILAAAVDVARPCLVTTLTTAAGFVAFSGASLESFARFGWLAAAGVCFALLHCFTLLPWLLWRLPAGALGAPAMSRRWESAMAGLAAAALGRPGWWVAAAAALFAVCAAGLPRLEVEASFEELYGERSAVVRWVRFVSENLRRPDTLEVALTPPPGAGPSEPAVLGTVAESGRILAAVDTLGPSHSLADAVAWAHRLLRGDAPEAERLPMDPDESAALVAALRLLGDDGGAGPDPVARWVAADPTRLRVSVESGKTAQEPLRRAMAAVEAHLATGLPPGWRGEATGPLAVVHEMVEDLRRTQLRSFAAAGVLVLVLVALYLRSPGFALLAFLPTLFPVVLTLGAMAWLDRPLDVGSAMVAAVVLGIAIDDTIHLLEHYRRGRAAGASAPEAMGGALVAVGRALVTTSLALGVGFSALALSPWQSVASFGLVSAVAIAGALASCLLLLPALVALLFRPRA